MAGAAFEPELAARIADDACDDPERRRPPARASGPARCGARGTPSAPPRSGRARGCRCSQPPRRETPRPSRSPRARRPRSRRRRQVHRRTSLPAARNRDGSRPRRRRGFRSDPADCRVRRSRPPARPRAASPPSARAQRPLPRSDAAGSRPARRRSRTAPPGARTRAPRARSPRARTGWPASRRCRRRRSSSPGRGRAPRARARGRSRTACSRRTGCRGTPCTAC